MALVEHIEAPADINSPCSREEREIRDYFRNSSGLIWQRQAIFFAATMLTIFYFDPAKSLACYGAVLFTELIDLMLERRVNKIEVIGRKLARNLFRWIVANTVLSAGAICRFVYMIALQQPVGGGHFTPLFFLFAASLFAAMNNHQLLGILIVRLAIYGVTFFAIVLMDIIRVNPPLSSDLWLQFFTVVFSTYFIIDCSFVFLKFYRKNLQQLEDLQEEHQRTKIAYKAKSQFVAIVSHELRTPLTSIKGSLDLMNSGVLGKVPKEMSSILAIAAKNSERLALLINDILDLQKFEAGEVDYRFGPVDLGELLHESVSANRGYADAHGITLSPEIAGAPAAVVRADERRLMQVMSNIISNAIKFSHEGGNVRLSYEMEGSRARILVTDEGVGIPEGMEERVFGMFTQVDATDQREVGGTGLGMNISKKIVEHHGGEIGYESVPGKGTTFYVDLDIWDQAKAA